MNKIRFSVLMAVYAREAPEHLESSLASLRAQTEPAAQVVIVCDGPLNKELDDKLATYSGRLPLTVVRLRENSGLAKALNAGLPYCRHDWVARFDSDDVCEPTRLAIQRQYIEANPGVDVFGSSILEFSLNPASPYACRTVQVQHDEIVKYAKRRSPMNHMTVCYRKGAVVEVGGYPLDELYEDYCLWVKLLVSGFRFGNIDKPLVRVRAGDGMVARRGGISYLKSEFQAQQRFWKMGFITTSQFIGNVAVRGVVRLSPLRARAWLYNKALRQPIRVTGGGSAVS